MKIIWGLILTTVAVLVSGCASVPQQSVSLSRDAIGSQVGRVGVAMTALPKIDTQFPGADCLLCMAAASLTNSSLTAHVQALTYEDLPELKNQAANLLRKRGANVVVIEEALDVNALQDFASEGPNIAEKDFTPLKQKLKIDKLLVIDITALGFIRTYSAYVPTSDPKALLKGTGYIVNLESNSYDWYQPVSITKSTDLNWDEPPKFPGLTNAYFQALEIGKDSFLQPLAAEVSPVSGAEVSSNPSMSAANGVQGDPQ